MNIRACLLSLALAFPAFAAPTTPSDATFTNDGATSTLTFQWSAVDATVRAPTAWRVVDGGASPVRINAKSHIVLIHAKNNFNNTSKAEDPRIRKLNLASGIDWIRSYWGFKSKQAGGSGWAGANGESQILFERFPEWVAREVLDGFRLGAKIKAANSPPTTAEVDAE